LQCARIVDANLEYHIKNRKVLFPFTSDPEEERPKTVLMSRATLEVLLERLLLKSCPNLKVVDGTVRSIEIDRSIGNGTAKVKKIYVKGLRGQDNQEIVNPSLVIGKAVFYSEHLSFISELTWLMSDCTGHARGSHAWLKSAGLTVPKDNVFQYNPQMHYLTTVFNPSEDLIAKLPIPGGWLPSFLYTRLPVAHEGENQVICCGLYEGNQGKHIIAVMLSTII
jgi:hypothetical protein